MKAARQDVPLEVHDKEPLPFFKALKKLVIFRLLLLIIAAVSVHDAALVVLNHEVIADFERNPIGCWLIEANGGMVWLFVTVKLLGTSVVCTLLAGIYEQSSRLGVAAAGPLAFLQTMLLVYLCLN